MNTTYEFLASSRPSHAPSRKLASLASDLLPLCDFVCLLATASLSTLLYALWLSPAVLAHGLASDIAHAALIAAVLAPFILYTQGFGADASRGKIAALLRAHALRLSMLAIGVLALGAFSHALNDFPPGWLLIWFASSLLVTSLTRVIAARVLQRLQRRGLMSEVVAVVGAGAVADRLVKALRQTRNVDIELLGVFDDRVDRAEPGSAQAAGTLAQLIALSKARQIDWIVVTLPPTAEARLLAIVAQLKALAIPIGLCPQHVGSALSIQPIDYVGDGVPLGLLADRPIKRWGAVVKLAEDFLIGGLLTLLLLPLLAAIAIAVKLTSPGPILFKQRRHTENNREFDIYKFRTMRWSPAASNEGLKQTARGDERITPVGRFLRSSSLDELPQLFNVLRGDMSLVGPRPHATNMRTEDRLGAEITQVYAHRHRVKPGITGWAQVNGARGATDTTEQLRRRVELDLHYITHWSPLLDLKILALTSGVVIKGTNAF